MLGYVAEQQIWGCGGVPYLHSHQAGTTSHIQDEGAMGQAGHGLGEAVHSEAGGTVVQGSHVLKEPAQ